MELREKIAILLKRAKLRDNIIAEKLGVSKKIFSNMLYKNKRDITPEQYEEILSILSPEIREMKINQKVENDLLFFLLSQNLVVSRTLLYLFNDSSAFNRSSVAIHELMSKHERELTETIERLFSKK